MCVKGCWGKWGGGVVCVCRGGDKFFVTYVGGGRKNIILVNRLGGLSLPRKSVVRLTDRPDMTIAVYRGRKTVTQQQLKRKKIQIHRRKKV